MKFEEMLEKLEPMISAHMRKIGIYKEHEQYRQAARVAIWKAWERFDPAIGDFEPYASQTIRGALLDELKVSYKYDEHFVPTESTEIHEFLHEVKPNRTPLIIETLEPFLTQEELAIIMAYYIDGYSHEEIARAFGMNAAALQKRKSRIITRLRKECRLHM